MTRSPFQISSALRDCLHSEPNPALLKGILSESADLIDSLHVEGTRAALYFGSLMLALASLKSRANDLVESVQVHLHDPKKRAVVWRDELDLLIEELAKEAPKLMTHEQADRYLKLSWTEESLVEPVVPITPIS